MSILHGSVASPTSPPVIAEIILKTHKVEKIYTNTKPGNQNRTLELVIEGKPYQWNEQYITDAELKQLAGLPADAKLYLQISEPWKDEPVTANVPIDLARPGLEQFYGKQKLKYTINGVHFESDRQYIKGAQIRKQGSILDDDQIFLSIKGPWEDELIEDQEWVDLARPGIEQFYSQKPKFKIIVDGTPKEWLKDRISFSEVIVLAFGKYEESPNKVYTVAYEDGPKQNPEGSMTKGAVVFVKNKMIFHATATDKS